MIEDFTCEIKVRPVEEWVQEQEEGNCHPCLIKPLAEYYMGALSEAKADEQVKKLESAWDSKDVLTIAKTLDQIKGEVGEDLKKELVTLDCLTESYKPAAE